MSIRNVALVFDEQVRPDTTGVYCRRALGKLLNVMHFPPPELSRIPGHGFDLYLSIDDGLEYRLPNGLHPCAWWAIDTHLNWESCLNRVRDFDFVFVAQRDGTERLQDAGIPAVWLPLACDPKVHVKYDVKKEFDISFVGHISAGPREDLLRLIQQRFPSHFVGQRFFQDMARTYSSSRTVFNRSLRNDINMRVFEALACGSLLVTNDLPENGQEDLFRDGIHLATYRNAEELLDKIAFYLTHEAARERIAAAGRSEVLGKDTYSHRMGFLLREMERRLAKRRTIPVSRPAAETAGAPKRHNLRLSKEDKRWDKASEARPAQPFQVRAIPGGGLRLVRNPILLSLCMIARDNARTIEACLTSIRPWVDEMIVVDTGSKDDTPRIARKLGARVYHFPWCDSFSAARNASLQYARAAWIFWMDSDDTIGADNGRELRQLTCRESKPSILGYGMQVHCPGPGEDGQLDVTVVDHVKLFRNRPDLRFEGRIHEQILPAIRRAGGEVELTNLFVVHSGYDHSPEGQKKKLERDFRLLHLELEERPNHPFTLFNLGMTYADSGEYEKAANFLNHSIEVAGPRESHLRKAYALLVYCYSQLGQKQSASATCRQGLRLFPEDAELRFREAVLLHESGRLQEAAQAYQNVLHKNGDRYFTSVDRGIAGFKTRQNLAVVYTDLGDLANAEKQWRLVVEEMPGYRQGWRGLGEVLLRQGKQDDALALAIRLRSDRQLHTEGTILKGQLALAKGDWQSARGEFESAVDEEPANVEAWQALCQYYFEHGDLSEVKGALLKLLRRNPQDASAYHNLGTVYMRLGQPLEAIEAYRNSLRNRPDSPNTFLQLGNALRETGQHREAIDSWDRALQLDPGNLEAAEALHPE